MWESLWIIFISKLYFHFIKTGFGKDIKAYFMTLIRIRKNLLDFDARLLMKMRLYYIDILPLFLFIFFYHFFFFLIFIFIISEL